MTKRRIGSQILMTRPKTKLKDGAKISEILMGTLANKFSSLMEWEDMMVDATESTGMQLGWINA